MTSADWLDPVVRDLNPVVELDEQDMRRGAAMGAHRCNRKSHSRINDLALDTAGARAELAAARYLLPGRPWTFQRWNQPDIRPDIEVRCATTAGHQLIVYDSDDPTARFLLVETRIDDPTWAANRFRIAGWLPGLHAMSREFRIERSQLRTGVGVWLIPNSQPPLWDPARLDPTRRNQHQ